MEVEWNPHVQSYGQEKSRSGGSNACLPSCTQQEGVSIKRPLTNAGGFGVKASPSIILTPCCDNKYDSFARMYEDMRLVFSQPGEFCHSLLS